MMTGAGKTFTGLSMLAGIVKTGLPCLVLVHRVELVDQWRLDAINVFGLKCGVLCASWGKNPEPNALLQVAAVDTLASRLKTADPFPRGFRFIIVDECHLAASNRYMTVLNHYNTLILGLSATPERLDGRGFPWASNLITGPTYAQLQDVNALTDFTVFSPNVLDVSDLKVKFGEITRKSQAKQYESQRLIGKTVEHYFKYAPGRTCITFVTTVKAAHMVCNDFNASNVESRVIHGAMHKDERKEYIEATRAGEIMNLINVDCLTEGLNITRVKAVICDFATLSIVRWRQAAGRALRPCDDVPFNDAIIVDTGGNGVRLGNLDFPYQWDITAREKRRAKPTDVAAAKRCPTCAGLNTASARECVVCGQDLKPQPQGLRRKAGELEALKSGAAPKSKNKRRTLNKVRAAEMSAWVASLK